MINTNNVLNAVTSMQQNAQAALPVIPNNGNPAGAHNMPQQGTGIQQAAPQQQTRGDYFYPWLAPSSHMETIRNNLTERQTRLNEMMTQYQPQPITPQAPMPAAPTQGVGGALLGTFGHPSAPPATQAPMQQAAPPPVLPMSGPVGNAQAQRIY